jgi:uncharacterized membrane protein
MARQLVRVQARLDAGVGDRWIPTMVTVALAATLAWSGLAKLSSVDTGVDLAAYSQGLWLLSEGLMPEASLFGSDIQLLELHWAFVMYPLALLALVFPPAKLLVVVQALALGVAVVPMWWLARRVADLRVGAATAVIAVFALHPATHRLGTDGFHPEVLAVPALIAMVYFGSEKRWTKYWLCIAFVLACRADLGLAVALWGFVVLQHRERSVGVWTLGVGLIWSLGLLLVVQPMVGGGGVASSLFGYDATPLAEVMLSAVRDPLALVADFLARENITLVVGLLAPVIFLPLLSLRYLAPAVPLAVLYLIADLPPEVAFVERSAMLLAFIMIAATFALNRLGHMGVDRVFLDVRVLLALMAATTLFFVSSSPISPYEQPWNWADRDETDAAIYEAVALIGEETAVRASPSALALLAERPWLFALDPERPPSAAQAGFPDFTRAVLVVEREIPERVEAEREELDRGMEAQEFVVVYDDHGVTLYSREEGAVAIDG